MTRGSRSYRYGPAESAAAESSGKARCRTLRRPTVTQGDLPDCLTAAARRAVDPVRSGRRKAVHPRRPDMYTRAAKAGAVLLMAAYLTLVAFGARPTMPSTGPGRRPGACP